MPYALPDRCQTLARQMPAHPRRRRFGGCRGAIGQLAKKDEQIAKLMETVADSTKAVQGAQALHHETAQTLALESTEQKLSRWQRLRRASGGASHGSGPNYNRVAGQEGEP